MALRAAGTQPLKLERRGNKPTGVTLKSSLDGFPPKAGVLNEQMSARCWPLCGGHCSSELPCKLKSEVDQNKIS